MVYTNKTKEEENQENQEKILVYYIMNTLFNSNVCPEGDCLDKCTFINDDEKKLNNLIEYLKIKGPEIKNLINEIEEDKLTKEQHITKIKELENLAIEIYPKNNFNYYYINGKDNKDGINYKGIENSIINTLELNRIQNPETYVKERKLYLVGYDQNMVGLAKNFILLNIEGPYLKTYQDDGDESYFNKRYIEKDKYNVRYSNELYLDRIKYDDNFKKFLDYTHGIIPGKTQTSGGKKFMKKYSRYAKKRYNKSNKSKKSNKKGKSRKSRK